MFQKGFVPLLILAILVVVMGAGFIVYKTIIPRTNIVSTSTGDKFMKLVTSTLEPTPTPTPVPVGSLTGKIIGGYYSKPIANVTINANGPASKKVLSDSNGSFNFSDLSIGSYNLSFNNSEYKFSPFSIDIKEGENKLDKEIYGSLINPKPMILNAYCFIDSNKNGTKNSGEKSIDASVGLFFYESGSWVLQKYLPCGTNGSFSETLTKIGKYKFIPGEYTFYTQPGSQELVVDGYGSTKNINLAYIPQEVESGFTVYVFNDKNENGSRDGDEENVHYQYVRVTNLSGTINQPLGNSYNSAVGTDGSSFNQFNPGTYKFELVPENSSWDAYYKITKREETITFDQNTSHQTIYLGAHKLY